MSIIEKVFKYGETELSVIKCKDDIWFRGKTLAEVLGYSNPLKGELQRQNKLISSERPFKILQNESKIIQIGQAVLEIFNFKD